MMKICLIASGTSIHTYRWANYFVIRGHEVHVISEKFNTDYDGFDVRIRKYQLVRLAPGIWKLSRFISGVFWIFQVGNLVRKIKPDILNAHYVNIAGYLGAICGFHPLIITTWGSDILTVPKQNKILGLITRWALKQADIVICVSSFMKDVIINMGIQPDKIVITPIGVDTQRFQPVGLSETINNSDPSRNYVRIISTRNLAAIYNVETFIKAIPIVIGKFSQLQFTVLGDGVLKKELQNLVNSLGISGKVSFIGKVLNDDLIYYLKSSDIYVSTSLSDGTSISLLEAMSCGLPCIVSEIPANKPWIKERENGLLFKPGSYEELADKIVSILDNKELRIKMGLAARALVIEKGDHQKEMAKIENIYYQLINKLE
jgi:L-malate glycosyltransferase